MSNDYRTQASRLCAEVWGTSIRGPAAFASRDQRLRTRSQTTMIRACGRLLSSFRSSPSSSSLAPMSADATHPKRFYQSRRQGILAWNGAAFMVAVAVFVLLVPTARHHGGYVIAGVALLIAVGMARFARCGVHVTTAGVRVTKLLSTIDVRWDEIREFRLAPVGACLLGLKDGRWVAIGGIEQTNLDGMTRRQDTPERRMIEELNDLLREHTGVNSTIPPVPAVAERSTVEAPGDHDAQSFSGD
jgi:hypothetical protein